MILRIFLMLGLVGATLSATAQSLVAEGGHDSPWLRTYRLQGWQPEQAQQVETPFPFTAFAVEVPQGTSLAGVRVRVGGVDYSLTADPHRQPGDAVTSALISVEGTHDRLMLTPGPWKSEIPVRVILVNSGATPKVSRATRPADASYCNEPPAIPQSEWREGLPAPSTGRGFAEVQNLIVHHAAGSNFATNYTQVVRDIYVFHTQGRGWSDIGYNYLIAQNGDLYLGRDPEDGAQDEVIGAHFCGANTGTMGVCLLGNYETAVVPDTMFGTLEQLLSWKAFKDELDPLGTANHRLNSSLGVIAGHRDGCATLCPGEDAYNHLEEMRTRVDARLKVCNSEVPVDSVPPTDSVVVYRITNSTPNLRLFASNPERVSILETQLYDVTGRSVPITIEPYDATTWEVQLQGTIPGVYILHLVVAGEPLRQRIRVL